VPHTKETQITNQLLSCLSNGQEDLDTCFEFARTE